MHENSALRKVRVQEIKREVPKFLSNLYANTLPEYEKLITTSMKEVLHVLFDNNNSHTKIRREVEKVDIPEALRVHTSLKQVNSLFVPVDSIFSEYLLNLSITTYFDEQPYLRTPLWNILGRLSLLPLALLRYDEARSLYLNHNSLSSSEEKREREERLRLAELSYEQSCDPILMKLENRRLLDSLRQLFSIVSSRILEYDHARNKSQLYSNLLKSYAQICAMLREIEDDHMGLTNTDRYLLLIALLTTSNRAVIVSTTADVLSDWCLKKNHRNFPLFKNPLMPIYFNVLLNLNDIQAGERNYLISSSAFFSAIQAMTQTELEIAKNNVNNLSSSGIVIKHAEIPEELRHISAISGSGILFTYRYTDQTTGTKKLFVLVRMNSSKAQTKLNQFYDVFANAEEITSEVIDYYYNKKQKS
ncbi:MAG: hypothetical protein N3E37_03675 [Candidatus Micrarchaeota archaeon]|nr:hypothetical protein [Candidatus Micrarchaeota archaeon]